MGLDDLLNVCHFGSIKKNGMPKLLPCTFPPVTSSANNFITSFTTPRFTVGVNKRLFVYLLISDWQIGITIKSSHASQATNVNLALRESRTSIPQCSHALSICDRSSFVLRMQVYSCKVHTREEHGSSVPLLPQKLVLLKTVGSATHSITYAPNCTVCHIRIGFIFVFMQRGEIQR